MEAAEKHHHVHAHEEHEEHINIVTLVAGIVVFIVAIILKFTTHIGIWNTVLFLAAYLLLAYDLIIETFESIGEKNFFNEDLLMCIASAGALAIGEPIEGIMVVLLFKIGEYFEHMATEKSRSSIEHLIGQQVEQITLADGGKKNIKEAQIGDVFIVRVGEQVPLDGKILEGDTDLDMKALTGESVPESVHAGDEILSGSINLTKMITVEVIREESDSTISKVIKLVKEAGDKKAKSEEFITRFAEIYTPVIIAIAMLVGVVQYFAFHMTLPAALNNVFTILVIACPCALVISIPLGFFAGIGKASSCGILVKGGNYLEALNKADTFVFDKTGTITKGNFRVVDVEANHHSKAEILKYMASVEQYSLHPIAVSIQEAYKDELYAINQGEIEEISGLGLKVQADGKTILVGNAKLMQQEQINFTQHQFAGTVVCLAVDGEYWGAVLISDEIKPEAYKLMGYLKEHHYKSMMLTGDGEQVAQHVAEQLHIDEVYSQLLPHQKYEMLETIINKKEGDVVYVGDGINDAPSLRLADIGIAMGTIGSDSAKEYADIVIQNDDIQKIRDAIKIARKTRKIVTENIILSLAIKLIALMIGVTGIMGHYAMYVALLADTGVCLLCILNVLRISRYQLDDNNKKQSK
ncbi:MAG: cadmium-translocating P-type ATPase [Bacteroidales bacterium]|nr:cadmium-translocating P-type ATPase [Bacteroidales bacterium]